MARQRQRAWLLAAVAVAAVAVLQPCTAHRPILTSPVGGKLYSTFDSALPLPWVNASMSVKRVVECDYPFFWMKFTADRSNQDLHLTLGTPAAPGLAATRPGLALFGPGLPPYNASALSFPAPPPRPGQGMLRLSSPADQTNCDFIENEVSRRSYKPANFSGVGTRCAFYEPFGKNWLWITADANVTLPSPGTYFLVSFLDGRKSTGRYTVAIADWKETEDFARPYATPAGNRNVSWGDTTVVTTCCPSSSAASASSSKAAAPAAMGSGGAGAAACPPWQAFGCEGPPLERSQLPTRAVRQVGPTAAAQLRAEGWPYVDVRTVEEFAGQRVPGSVNVPFMLEGPTGREPNPKFLDQMGRVLLPCSKILVGCQTGKRARAAAEVLKLHYAEVVAVDEGIVGWAAAGLQVEDGGGSGGGSRAASSSPASSAPKG